MMLLRPDLSLSIENVIQRVDLSFRPLFDTPDCGAEPGQVYQIWRIEGQFYQQLDFHKYPLDTHRIELRFEDSIYGSDYLIYVRDKLIRDGYGTAGIAKTSYLSGWTIKTFSEFETNPKYFTNFGAASKFFAENSYSSYSFGVLITRGALVYILKALPPIVITLIITGLVFMMDIEAMDVRIGTAVSGLLTLVFLELTFSSKLPASLDYLTLVEWVFNLGYLLSLSLVVECIVIRKIYYRLLLQTENLKDEIQLTTLFKAAVSRSTVEEQHEHQIEEDEMAMKAKHLRIRKQIIKRRIRHLEKILFIVYIVLGALVIFLISIIGNFV